MADAVGVHARDAADDADDDVKPIRLVAEDAARVRRGALAVKARAVDMRLDLLPRHRLHEVGVELLHDPHQHILAVLRLAAEGAVKPSDTGR